MEPEPPGAASFCLEPEPTQVGRSQSRLRDLGHQEPEPPEKVAALQHCLLALLLGTALSSMLAPVILLHFFTTWIRIQGAFLNADPKHC